MFGEDHWLIIGLPKSIFSLYMVCSSNFGMPMKKMFDLMLYVNVNACSWKFIGHCMLHWSLHQIQCLSDHTSKSCVSVLGSWKESVNTQLTRCVGHRDKWRTNILLLGHDINMLIFTTCLTTRVYKVFISSCKCVSSVRKLNLSR